MRCIALIVLVLLTSLFTACSYITNFVVVNTSDQPVVVRIQFKAYPGPFDPSPLRTAPASRRFEGPYGGGWGELSSAQYAVNPESRMVTLRLMPDEALLAARVHRGGMQVDDAQEAEDFALDGIIISGARGEIRLEGEQLRKAFVPETKEVYTLRYK